MAGLISFPPLLRGLEKHWTGLLLWRILHSHGVVQAEFAWKLSSWRQREFRRVDKPQRQGLSEIWHDASTMLLELDMLEISWRKGLWIPSIHGWSAITDHALAKWKIGKWGLWSGPKGTKVFEVPW